MSGLYIVIKTPQNVDLALEKLQKFYQPPEGVTEDNFREKLPDYVAREGAVEHFWGHHPELTPKGNGFDFDTGQYPDMLADFFRFWENHNYLKRTVDFEGKTYQAKRYAYPRTRGALSNYDVRVFQDSSLDYPNLCFRVNMDTNQNPIFINHFLLKEKDAAARKISDPKQAEIAMADQKAEVLSWLEGDSVGGSIVYNLPDKPSDLQQALARSERDVRTLNTQLALCSSRFIHDWLMYPIFGENLSKPEDVNITFRSSGLPEGGTTIPATWINPKYPEGKIVLNGDQVTMKTDLDGLRALLSPEHREGGLIGEQNPFRKK